jgi:hypothetical protein
VTEETAPSLVTRPSAARLYDHAIGGKDNYTVDRSAGALIKRAHPQARELAVMNRAALRRGVRFLAAEAGIRQFLDLGSGLPTQDNTHEVAQRADPQARVVYIDNDPIVLAHARALLIENHRTDVVAADLRDVRGVVTHPGVCRLIDFSEPVAVVLAAILHHLPDSDDPAGLVAAYLDGVPSGSFLFLTSFCGSDPGAAPVEQAFLTHLGTGWFRPPAVIQGYFEGLEMIEPGLVPLSQWRPDTAFDRELFPTDRTRLHDVAGELPLTERLIVGGMARKP